MLSQSLRESSLQLQRMLLAVALRRPKASPDSQDARGQRTLLKMGTHFLSRPNTFQWIRHWSCPINVFQNWIPGQIYDSPDIMSIMTLTFGLERHCPIKSLFKGHSRTARSNRQICWDGSKIELLALFFPSSIWLFDVF